MSYSAGDDDDDDGLTTTSTTPTGAHLCALTTADDDPPNSRRPSLQTITPVALIFSWLLFDGTTRKCIIRLARRLRRSGTLTARKSALSSLPRLTHPSAHTPFKPSFSLVLAARCFPFGTPPLFRYHFQNLLPTAAAVEEEANAALAATERRTYDTLARAASPELITNRSEYSPREAWRSRLLYQPFGSPSGSEPREG